MPRGVLVDLGGVLVQGLWPNAAPDWCERLGINQSTFLAAVFGGNDDQVLIGRVSEDAWWDTIRDRLHIDEDQARHLRADVEADETWDLALVDCLQRAKPIARSGILSNAWPGTRARLEARGYGDIVHELVISAEVGAAKPDPRIYWTALDRIGVEASEVLFIDDTPVHVETAEGLGMVGHVHRDGAETVAMIEEFVRPP